MPEQPEQKQETVGEVVAAMRRYAELVASANADTSPELAQLLREYADRVDAAYKREHADWHAETDAAKDDRNHVACRMRREFAEKCRNCTERAPGNAAAMRAALECIVGCCEGCHADACEKVCRPQLTSESIHAALAALAAPARNCDVGTAQEQKARHERFCAAHYKSYAVDAQCFGCPASDKKETDCEFVWGQLPFVPAEGGDRA